jgi:hypothetical protein
MMQSETIPLRDIHQPPAPPWWPPAPGWWVVAGCVVLILVVAGLFAWRRHSRQRVLAQVFDTAVAAATTPSAKIAAMSELLRRAGRRIDPDADKLLGDDWLRFLDRGSKAPAFAAGAGAALRDGGYRRDVSELEVDALQQLARARFLEWMGSK